jgi:DNA repair protein RadC
MLALSTLPTDLRPRERLRRHGPRALADWELIALVLGQGTRHHDVVRTAHALLERFGSLAELGLAEPEALADVAGVGPAQAGRLAAALELGARRVRPAPDEPAAIRTAADVYRRFRSTVLGLAQEVFWVVALTVRHRVIREVRVAEGSLSSVEVHPREVFRPLVRLGAAAALLVHNHPSGDPTPSVEDVALTRRLAQVGRVVGIPVIDHVVVCSGGHASLAEIAPESLWAET